MCRETLERHTSCSSHMLLCSGVAGELDESLDVTQGGKRISVFASGFCPGAPAFEHVEPFWNVSAFFNPRTPPHPTHTAVAPVARCVRVDRRVWLVGARARVFQAICASSRMSGRQRRDGQLTISERRPPAGILGASSSSAQGKPSLPLPAPNTRQPSHILTHIDPCSQVV